MRPPTAPDPTALVEAAATADVLLVPDADLAAAITRRAPSGVTVQTPEAAVGARVPTRSERLDALVQSIDAPIAALVRAIERCEHSWRFRGDPAALATSPLETAVADAMRDGPEATLAAAGPLEGDVATLVPAAFDPLQSSIIPETATVVTGDSRPTATRRRADTVTGATSAIAAAIDEPTETAVVAPPWLRGHVAGTLAASGYDVGVARETTGDPAALELLWASATEKSTTVGDVSRLLADLGVSRSGSASEQPVSVLEGETAVWLAAVTASAGDLTVGTLCEQLGFRRGDPVSLPAIEALGLADATPTPAVVRDIEAYHEATAEGPSGTLAIVDAGTAWTGGRSTLMLLADERPWYTTVPVGLGQAWRDRERHRLAQLVAFADECHLVATADAPPIAGWLAADGPSTAVGHAPSPTQPVAFTPERRPRGGHDRLTKSRLNRLLVSPRDAQFAAVLDRPDRRALTRGSAIHDYADLLVAAPAAVEAIGRERIRSWIVDQVAPFVPDRRRPLLESRLEAAMAVVEAAVEGVRPPPTALAGLQSPHWMENSLATAFEVAIERTATEQYFVDEDLGVSGIIDLVRSPTHLVDFKTGRPRTPAGLVADGRVPPTTRTPDTQLPLYLAAARRARGDRELAMTFVYTHGFLTSSLQGAPPVDALSSTVRYRPTSRDTATNDPVVVTELVTTVASAHPRARLGAVVSAETLATALAGADDPSSAIAAAGRDGGLEDETARAGARSLIGAHEQHLDTTLFADDLDAFEAFLADWHERRDRYDREGYPFGDPPADRLEFPTLHVDRSPLEVGSR